MKVCKWYKTCVMMKAQNSLPWNPDMKGPKSLCWTSKRLFIILKYTPHVESQMLANENKYDGVVHE